MTRHSAFSNGTLVPSLSSECTLMTNQPLAETSHNLAVAEEQNGVQQVKLAEKQRDASAADDAEVSIEDYMAGLLARVRNKSQAMNVYVPPIESQADGDITPSPDSTPEVPYQFVPRVPREQNPLTRLDIRGMRELAQSHAQHLHDNHRRRQDRWAAWRQGVCVMAILALAITLAVLSWEMPAAEFPSLVCFAVALVWGLQCLHSVLSIMHGADSTKSTAGG